MLLPSLPSRECGLKSVFPLGLIPSGSVTPFAGVWIEIVFAKLAGRDQEVTPFAGVWIEIPLNMIFTGW